MVDYKQLINNFIKSTRFVFLLQPNWLLHRDCNNTAAATIGTLYFLSPRKHAVTSLVRHFGVFPF